MITKCKRLKDLLFMLFWVIFVMVFAFWFVKQANHQTELVDSIRVIKSQTKTMVKENQELIKDMKEVQINQGQMIENMEQTQKNQGEILEEIRHDEKSTVELLNKKHPEGQ